MLSHATVETALANAGLPGASIVIQSLDDDRSVRLRAEAGVYPASMIKVPIALALARSVRAGTFGWQECLTVHARNLTTNDAPSPFVEGYRAPLLEYLRAMISRSDNVATNVLIDVAGRELLTFGCRELGLEGTAVRRKLSGALPLIHDPVALGRNAHPACDAAKGFEYLGRAGAEALPLADALANQYWNDKLSPGWDPADTFAHKTGETDDTSHDGGILTLAEGRRYVVVVYTTLPSNADTDRRFAELARGLRPHLAAP